MDYIYKTKDVCSREIRFHIDGNVVSNISFVGGCNGNLKAVAKLLEGQQVEYIEEKLRGNSCGGRPTSCADQLAIAVREAYDKELKKQA